MGSEVVRWERKGEGDKEGGRLSRKQTRRPEMPAWAWVWAQAPAWADCQHSPATQPSFEYEYHQHARTHRSLSLLSLPLSLLVLALFPSGHVRELPSPLSSAFASASLSGLLRQADHVINNHREEETMADILDHRGFLAKGRMALLPLGLLHPQLPSYGALQGPSRPF